MAVLLTTRGASPKIGGMNVVRSLFIATAIVAVFGWGEAKGAEGPPQPSKSSDRLKVYTTRHFVLKSDTPVAYARELGRKLDLYFDQLGRLLPSLLGEPLQPVKTSVILFQHQDDYQRFANRNAPQLVNNGGYYDGATRTIVTYRFNNSLQLYFHEILHAVMGELFKDHYFFRYSRRHWPIWFDEGLAEYYGSFQVSGNTLVFGSRNKTKIAYLLNAMASGTFVDLPELLVALSDRYSGATMNLFYAEAWGLMDFLMHTARYKKMIPKFYAAIRGNADGLTAFKRYFGSDLADLNRRWRAHLRSLGAIPYGWQSLFNGISIDDWTVHEGGKWHVRNGTIHGKGDENYNYLVKSELPHMSFTLSLDVRLDSGTTGVILGNNYHGEYPYYYLIDLAQNRVTLRHAHSATRIVTIKDVHPHLPQKTWLPVNIQVVNDRLKVWVNGQKVLDEQESKARYSLFGVYLYRGRAGFKNLRLRKESPIPPAAPRQ
jgi:hypothetical protein